MTLNGKVALITGASKGIGKAIATRLGKDGATIALNYRKDEKVAQAAVKELAEQGIRAQAFCADVSNPIESEKLVGEVVQAFGKLDILCSNAGIEHFGKLADITPEDFQRVFATNVGGQLFAVKAAAPDLPKGGRIVLTSSVSARIAVYYHTLYAASKAAVSAMVLNLAPKLGEREITINAIAPGGTNTSMAEKYGAAYTHPALKNVPPADVIASMTSARRMAEPEEIAGTVAFLVSADASYISGSTVHIDGGWI